MQKNRISATCRVIFTLAFLICLCVPQVAARGPDPERPRRGFLNPDAPLPAAPEPQAQPDGENLTTAARLPWSKVVFQSYRNSNYEIYLANDDGSGLVRITNDSKSDITPRLNRGGTRIVFASNRAGNYEIYAVNPDGKSLARLTNNSQNDTNPRWSPDGSKIAFQTNRDGNYELYTMNANGSGLTRLTYDAGDDLTPAWSPDGSQIAWMAYRDGRYRIWVMNANGSGAVQLSNQPYSENPSFSPDGSQIAFDADADDNGWQEVWVMNADGSNQHELLNPGYEQDAYVRSWSPDGNYICYTHAAYTYYNSTWYWMYAYLRMLSPTQNPPTELELLGTDVDWSPDWQTLDPTNPSSSMAALPATSPGPFLVSWSGGDTGGSGLKDYDIQVRDGAGAWNNWLTPTSSTSAFYPGVGGHTYFFRARARDHSANLESWPADWDATTTVEALAPETSLVPLPALSIPTIPLSWTGSDAGGSGVKSYDIQVRDNGADWTDWLSGTTQTSAIFNGTSGHSYAFRLRALDNALNQEAWTPGAQGDAATRAISFSLSGRVLDNTGSPIAGAGLVSNPEPAPALPSGTHGTYSTLFTTAESTVTVNWNKTGYGSLPDTVFNAPSLNQLDVVLPPQDNLVANSSLEFDANLEAPWQGSGISLPQVVPQRHTGESAVWLGAGSAPLSSGSTVLTQTLSIPAGMTHPILSFFYQLKDASLANGGEFNVQVTHGADTSTLWSTTQNTAGWLQRSLDLQAFAGQEISLRFSLDLAAGQLPAYALIDDVTLGTANPDLWVSDAGSTIALPGTTFTLVLAYGNRSLVPANGSQLTLTLPDQLTFISADTAPSGITGQVLSWDIATLDGQSSAILHITVSLAGDAAPFNTLSVLAAIQAAPTELEQANNSYEIPLFIGTKVYTPFVFR